MPPPPLAMCRHRIYIVGIRLDGSVTSLDPDAFFQKFERVLGSMRSQHLPVESVLLPSDSPYLVKELERRIKHREEQQAKEEEDQEHETKDS